MEISNGNYANICKAFLLKNYHKHQDYNNSLILLKNNKKHPFYKFLNNFIDLKSNTNGYSVSDTKNLWDIFCPEAINASFDPELFKKQILKKRILNKLQKPKKILKYPHKEILFLSNVLVTLPQDYNSPNIPSIIRNKIKEIKNRKQSFWYDHPIPLDASDNENEILYGLRFLDRALSFEFKRGNIGINNKIHLVLSLSVTHKGLEKFAIKYIEFLIKKKLKLKFIKVFVFDENKSSQIINTIFPKNNDFEEYFGVNGNYGRHYTFLKYILLLWNKVIDENFNYSFKIDLDQVFDQKFLLKISNQSFFEILKSQVYWGGSGYDYKDRFVDLGMLAGGLINKSDTSKGYVVPDVRRPNNKNIFSKISSKRVFCPDWSHALSTETEILSKKINMHRIHVTGGTTGITIDALNNWAPFTPSFISRAEDQAFVLSSIKKNKFLSHLHAKNLIMRHDKLDFAKRTISQAKMGKEISNLERILLFSYYSKCNKLSFANIKSHFWPYTSSFIQRCPETMLCLVLIVDGLSKSDNYMLNATQRLNKTKVFCQKKMNQQFQTEQQFWKIFTRVVRNMNSLKTPIRDIIINSQIKY